MHEKLQKAEKDLSNKINEHLIEVDKLNNEKKELDNKLGEEQKKILNLNKDKLGMEHKLLSKSFRIAKTSIINAAKSVSKNGCGFPGCKSNDGNAISGRLKHYCQSSCPLKKKHTALANKNRKEQMKFMENNSKNKIELINKNEINLSTENVDLKKIIEELKTENLSLKNKTVFGVIFLNFFLNFSFVSFSYFNFKLI